MCCSLCGLLLNKCSLHSSALDLNPHLQTPEEGVQIITTKSLDLIFVASTFVIASRFSYCRVLYPLAACFKHVLTCSFQSPYTIPLRAMLIVIAEANNAIGQWQVGSCKIPSMSPALFKPNWRPCSHTYIHKQSAFIVERRLFYGAACCGGKKLTGGLEKGSENRRLGQARSGRVRESRRIRRLTESGGF